MSAKFEIYKDKSGEFRGGDKSKRTCDKSIVNNEPETQHEKHHSLKGYFSNVVGYVDL